MFEHGHQHDQCGIEDGEDGPVLDGMSRFRHRSVQGEARPLTHRS